jgi:outer membrane immunogenic protein
VRRFLLAYVSAMALTVGFANSALPADLSIYTKAPVAPYRSWTGFYAGVDVGYGWNGDPTVSFSPNNTAGTVALGSSTHLPPTTAGADSFDNKGAFGGVEIGYNWQVGRSWLVGIETDFNASDIKGQGAAAFPVGGGATAVPTQSGSITSTQNVSWFGTVRPRLGWLATDNLLLYGTGGFAYGRVNETVNYSQASGSGVLYAAPPFDNSSIICVATASCFTGGSTRNAVGWAAGAGTEYRVPGTNASIKAEYLYVNLGGGDVVTATNVYTAPGAAPGSFSAHYSTTEFQTVKLGLNWHF